MVAVSVPQIDKRRLPPVCRSPLSVIRSAAHPGFRRHELGLGLHLDGRPHEDHQSRPFRALPVPLPRPAPPIHALPTGFRPLPAQPVAHSAAKTPPLPRPSQPRRQLITPSKSITPVKAADLPRPTMPRVLLTGKRGHSWQRRNHRRRTAKGPGRGACVPGKIGRCVGRLGRAGGGDGRAEVCRCE